ncbi:MAG: hypothetical protein HY896_11465 [Deltaproteobacteria bacterium]|nr:hypothetical protein [Deltaproteobacteria bacterium]
MHSVQRGSRIGGAFIVLFSLAWCGALYASIIMGAIKKGVNTPMTLFLLVFSLPGLVFLYAGLSSLFGRTVVTLSSDTVEVLRKGVGRSRCWKEPLKAFTGVLRRAVRHQSNDGPDYTEYQLLLAHSNPQKEVRLFNSLSSAGWDSAWHSFADLLRLPLLDESELGIYQVGGKAPVRKTSTPEGASMVRVDARGIEVRPEYGGYRFRFSNAWTAWRGALGMLIAGGTAAIARMMQPQYPNDTLLVVLTWVMIGFVLISFGSLLSLLRGHEELTVTRDRVEYRRWSGRNDRYRSATMYLPTAEIRSVTVKSDPLVRGTLAAVIIEGTGDSIRLASWKAFRVKLELMRGIAAALGEVTGKGAGAFQPDIVLPGLRQTQRHSAVLLIGAIAAFFAAMVPLMWLAFHDRPTEQVPRRAADVAGVKPPRDRSVSTESSPEGAETIRLEMKSLQPQQNRVATRSENAPLPLSSTSTAGLRNLPEDHGEVWYGKLSLGEEPQHFPIVLAAGAPARLWLDRNRNGDLSDDGPPIQSRGTSVFAAEVQATVAPIEKPLSLWLYTNDRLWKERQLTFYNRTQLVGRPIVGGREFLVVVAERGRHDGNFSNDGIYVDINRDGKIDPSSEYVPPGGGVSLLGRRYRFEVR